MTHYSLHDPRSPFYQAYLDYLDAQYESAGRTCDICGEFLTMEHSSSGICQDCFAAHASAHETYTVINCGDILTLRGLAVIDKE